MLNVYWNSVKWAGNEKYIYLYIIFLDRWALLWDAETVLPTAIADWSTRTKAACATATFSHVANNELRSQHGNIIAVSHRFCRRAICTEQKVDAQRSGAGRTAKLLRHTCRGRVWFFARKTDFVCNTKWKSQVGVEKSIFLRKFALCRFFLCNKLD